MLGDRKVWTSVVLVLVTSWALWISSFSATRTPRPRLPGDAAILTASRRLSGPSAPLAVAGRMAPTSTTGLLVAVVRSRKNAVSSIVSVPWVTTIPLTPGLRGGRAEAVDVALDAAVGQAHAGHDAVAVNIE